MISITCFGLGMGVGFVLTTYLAWRFMCHGCKQREVVWRSCADDPPEVQRVVLLRSTHVCDAYYTAYRDSGGEWKHMYLGYELNSPEQFKWCEIPDDANELTYFNGSTK